jgi:NAD-dependent SIR2 family protein deacetylase
MRYLKKDEFSLVKPKCKLVIINNTPTEFDKYATLIVRESCGQVLEDAVK